MSRDQAVESYILLRLRTEDIKRLDFLVKELHERTIQLPDGSPFPNSDLKDTVRTVFYGWFAVLTDKDDKAVYAFDPLLTLFPDKQVKLVTEYFNNSETMSLFTPARAFPLTSKLAGP